MSIYVSIIEKSLGFPLEKIAKNVGKISNRDLEKLAINIERYYTPTEYKLKEKKNSLRPYISPIIDRSLADLAGFKTAFISDPSDVEVDMKSFFKKILLYSESVCFHDPLVYHLDFFRLNCDGAVASEHRAMVFYLINLYSELKDLFANDIIIPISDTVFPSFCRANLTCTDEEVESIYSSIGRPSTESDDVICRYNLNHIKEFLGKRTELGSNFDIVLSHDILKTCYIGLMKHYRHILTKTRVEELTYSYDICAISSLNVDRLSVKDIVNIRKNEEAFCQWRMLLTSILSESADVFYKDGENPFSEIARERINNMNKKINRSHFLKNLGRNGLKDLSIGIFGGLVGGLVTQDYLSGIAGAGSGVILKGLLDLYGARENRAVKDHYLLLLENESA